MMEHLLRAVETAVVQQNWYAALTTALALPDICAWVENPSVGSRARYVAWFDRFLRPLYTKRVGASQEEMTFLTGDDCYALRCAFLHEGRDDVTEQKAQDVVERFEFTVAPPGWVVHCNMSMVGGKLQLQVDQFCAEIVGAVRAWFTTVLGRPDVQSRLLTLLRLHDVNGNVID
jgi:hypothetical protein